MPPSALLYIQPCHFLSCLSGACRCVSSRHTLKNTVCAFRLLCPSLLLTGCVLWTMDFTSKPQLSQLRNGCIALVRIHDHTQRSTNWSSQLNDRCHRIGTQTLPMNKVSAVEQVTSPFWSSVSSLLWGQRKSLKYLSYRFCEDLIGASSTDLSTAVLTF